MIKLKSPAEIELMAESGRIIAEVKQVLWDAIKPGMTTQELDDIAFKEIIKRGVTPAFKGYQGFTGTACISINEELIHGVPGPKVIKEGDIIKVDIGCVYKGWFSDSAFTKGVGKISEQDKKLIAVAKDAFYIGVDQIKPGARVGDIEAAIGDFVKSKGMFVPEGFTGHGIGRDLHEQPHIHNKGYRGTGPLLKDGMVIAIEPMILQKSDDVIIQKDGWTVVATDGMNTAHYEHTIAIVDGRPIILTEGI